jgi:hypothetical protein
MKNKEALYGKSHTIFLFKKIGLCKTSFFAY